MASDPRRWVRRGLWLSAGTLVLSFAVQGGEYSTLDLLRQKKRLATLSRSIDSLQRVVDSLKRYENLVVRDAATQERIAREEFGMVRGEKELLYRFDTARADGGRQRRQ